MSGWNDGPGWPAWSLSNHDVIRFPTRLCDDDPERIKLLIALLLSLKGTAYLYQGDELGLPHADVPFERLRDPEAIAFWPHGIGRDGARAPMPWSRTARMAGFTEAGDAWLPLDPRHGERAVDVQQGDANSVLAFTRAMVGVRRASAALRQGGFEPLAGTAPDVLGFTRRAQDQCVRCWFNLGPEAAVIADPAVGKVPLLQHGPVAKSAHGWSLGGFSALLVEIEAG